MNHHPACDWFCDQYDFECTCGVTRPKAPWFDEHAKRQREAMSYAPVRVAGEEVERVLRDHLPVTCGMNCEAAYEGIDDMYRDAVSAVLALIGTSGGKDLGSDRCVGPSSDAQSVRPDGGEG